ncbi:hypothetical protein [Aquamicrobium terrae]|uniref:Uncharacterized protein n=1 Tax=Aquamicrobium terrae TaxID=1324945 RepID=A0ABV2MXN7_9HYPH
MNTKLILESPGIFPLFLLLTLTVAIMPNSRLTAQGLDAEGALDTIIGSDVNTKEEPVAAEEGRIVAAIEQTPKNISEVRRRFTIDRVDIVFLPDFGDGDSTVQAKLAEFDGQIVEMRKEIEGSAIFFHALNSRSVLLRDVVALEFDDANGVTIFVAGGKQGTNVD